MLEDHSCLVSRALQSSCEQESKWPYAKCGLEAVVSKGKRPLDSEAEEEESGSRKSAKLSDIMGEVQSINIQSYSSLEGGGERINSGDQHQAGNPPSAQFVDQQQGGDPPSAQTGEQQQGGDDQPGDQQQGGDQSDTDNLIHPIGRDITINCLLHCSRADYGSIASLNRGFRSLVRSGEMYKLRRMNGVVEHWVYFSCQLLEWVAFDPVARRWMNLPRMNVNECFMCSDKESLAVGTQLLLFGKEVTSHVMYKYSILTNSWSLGDMMNAPRCLFGSASLGHIAILAGGCDSRGNIRSSAELYDSEKETWEVLPDMIKPRKMCSGVFMDGKFCVIGGIGGSDSKLLTSAEEFDMETRTWKEIPNMSPVGTGPPRENEMPPSSAPPLVAVVNNELYAADYADMEVRKYNKVTSTWSTVGKLPERAGSMNGWGLAFRGCGDRLIVIGGPRAYGEGVIEVNSWVPNDDPPQWTLLARKQLGSFVYNCAVMGC
uniref:Putative kelch repeat containing F-box protein n=1 Tax=Persicaria minor TaxID=488003 RepID=H9CXX1_9CARY|nr:putative kelch repeat containing F-box protein [Persicaria minor]